MGISVSGNTVEINGKRYHYPERVHSVSNVNGRVLINGKPFPEDGDAAMGHTTLEVHIHGDIKGDLTVKDGSVECGNVGGSVDAGGSVTCKSVGKDVDAGGSVSCGNVTGDVDAGGSVNCGNVTGSVDAGGSVLMGRRG